MSQGKNYAFIDGNNLYLGAKSQHIKLDYKKFRLYLKNKMNVEKAFLFIGFDPDRISFYRFLQECGFILVYKPTVVYYENDKKYMKGNVDAELVLHASAIQYSKYDKAVIISSDGDFACLIEYLIEKSKLYKIVTPTKRFSSLLRRFSKHVLPIAKISNAIRQSK